MFLPDIRTYRNETPTLAYLCGTNSQDKVRLLGQIDEDGACTLITLHFGGSLVGDVDVVQYPWV